LGGGYDATSSPQESHILKKNSKMERTIIIGEIEYTGNNNAIIHSVEEVLKASTEEELQAMEDIPYAEGKAWIVVEDYLGDILVTRQCLIKLIS